MWHICKPPSSHLKSIYKKKSSLNSTRKLSMECFYAIFFCDDDAAIVLVRAQQRRGVSSHFSLPNPHLFVWLEKSYRNHLRNVKPRYSCFTALWLFRMYGFKFQIFQIYRMHCKIQYRNVLQSRHYCFKSVQSFWHRNTAVYNFPMEN